MAISGYSGLFRFVSQGRHGVIVESLADGKRMNAPATAKISSFTDISIFTDSGDLPLRDVLKRIKELEGGKPAIDPKAKPDELKKYFAQVLPNYDRDRVYNSHIQKVVGWYNQLQSLNMLDLLDEKEEGSAKSEGEAETPASEGQD